MRRWILFTGHLIVLFVFSSFISFAIKNNSRSIIPNHLIKNYHDRPLIVRSKLADNLNNFQKPPVFTSKGIVGFKEAIGFKESQGDYSVVNTLGYMGKYQFGENTLNSLGIKDIKNFLKNPSLQEKAMEANMARNKWIMRNYIKRYVGKHIRGVKITESGIIAACHLSGAGNVKKFLSTSGADTIADAYGSTVREYMKKFGGYDLSNIPKIKNAKVTLD